MRWFGRSASKLAAGPTLVLAADPGPALFDEARRYDPGVRYSKLLRRLIFSNGVLLLGPVQVTPGEARQAGLPEGTVVAWYALAALQEHQDRRVHDAKASTASGWCAAWQRGWAGPPILRSCSRSSHCSRRCTATRRWPRSR